MRVRGGRGELYKLVGGRKRKREIEEQGAERRAKAEAAATIEAVVTRMVRDEDKAEEQELGCATIGNIPQNDRDGIRRSREE